MPFADEAEAPLLMADQLLQAETSGAGEAL